MKPISFKEQNCIIGKNQKEYLPLPAWKSKNGIVISCWQLSFLEKIKLLFTGKLWFTTLTFNKSLQPQRLTVDYPFEGK